MAWVRVTEPTDPVADDADWTDIKGWVQKLLLQVNGALIEQNSDGDIEKGSLVYIGGTLYYNDADLTPSGTASLYIKISPSGATATAAYVSSLSGVSWNSEYCGWYDTSGNLYVFDEGWAFYIGQITELHSRYVGIDKYNNTNIAGSLLVKNSVTGMTGLASGGAITAVDNITTSSGNVTASNGYVLAGDGRIEGTEVKGGVTNGFLYGSRTGAQIYAALENVMDNAGDIIMVSGSLHDGSYNYQIGMGYKSGSTVYLYGMRSTTNGLNTFSFTASDSASYIVCMGW